MKGQVWLQNTVLGIPAIYVNSMEAETINEQEKYGLIFHFRNGVGVKKRTNEYTKLKTKIAIPTPKILADKIDVTAFFVWLIEN